MAALQSDRDAILVAIPMVILLFAAFFRLDELVCRTDKRPGRGRKLTNWDKNGQPLCSDPEKTDFGIVRREYSRESIPGS